ncbi:MAG: L,D-transpeptidase family protein [Ilumatobacter sp.]|uniref:L,D-transpeptidase family protein n=1 Tax=Ilumatobacter sp. TaxID=1967498 RepID=UPI003919E1CB
MNTSDGVETARVQERLLELGFWLQRSDGDYGLTTTQAVMAFQKYHGLATSASVDEATAALLSAEGTRATGLADAGTLVEIDKSRQLVIIVQDGLAAWVLNGSTGSEIPYEAVNDKDPTKIERGDAVTPVGLYHTERERPDGWWAGDLGEIYRPKYFVGGIAVHGSNSIPNYPASHGCVRVSVPAMDFIWESDLMPLGINVWVHGEIPSA